MSRTSPTRPVSMNAAQEAGWPRLAAPGCQSGRTLVGLFLTCFVVVQAPLLDPFGRACFAAVCTDLGILLPCYPDGAQLTAPALLTRKL